MLRLSLALVLLANVASAQTSTARRVNRGEVTGVELQIEGALTARRGETLRWSLVAYEVVGLDQLRPAAGAEITIATSLKPGEFAAEATADARGRALVEIEVPEDAGANFGANVRVHARRGVSRRFDLQVQLQEPRVLELRAAPAARAGGTLPVFGRYQRFDGRAIPEAAIELQAYDSRGPLGRPVRVESDLAGVFTADLRIPRDAVAPLRVTAKGPEDEEERRIEAAAAAVLLEPAAPPLVVAVSTDGVVHGSRARVPVQVVIRRADGRPVEGALVRVGNQPVPLTREEEEAQRRLPLTRTDARGRATLEYEAPRVTSGYRDVNVQVQVGRAGIGRATGSARLRITNQSHFAQLSVEGGALVPTLGARLFAEVVRADGHRAPAGVPVVFTGPRIGRHEATTDASGIAVASMQVGPKADEDRCGGDAVTAVDMKVANNDLIRLCVPVDPDAATRVTVGEALVGPGDTVSVEIERTAAAARLPVAVTVFNAQNHPVHTTVLAPRTNTLEIEASGRGAMRVRARPLVGTRQEEARGSFAAFWVAPDRNLNAAGAAEGSTNTVNVRSTVQGAEHATTLAVLWPLGQPFDVGPATLSDPRGEWSANVVAAHLARSTPLDIAAPIRLRGRTTSPAPEPASPEQYGLLRDPWRASARFVEGRLALVFRAIEQRIESAVPEQIDEVASVERGRFRFNRQLLASLQSGQLGSEGATGLGGEPLTIERLEALDRAFTYDNVARRITRRRLFKILLALRAFVQQQALDLAWTRPGDPTLWIERLRNQYVPQVGQLRPAELVDGWGRPFRLRATGRARFTRVQPVDGYELVSAGPDGRFGNGDDVANPIARVLPNGSLYGRAVGEDALVARLQGVELGRATLDMAARVFGVGAVGIPAPSSTPRGVSLGSLPAPIEPDRWALALRRPTQPADSRVQRIEGNASVEVGDEPRTWRAALLTITPDGSRHIHEDGVRAGSSVLRDLILPSRLRVGEPLNFQLHLTDVSNNGTQLNIQASAEGIDVNVDSSLQLPAGETRTLPVRLEGRAPGRSEVVVQVTTSEGTQSVRGRVDVDRGLHPVRRRTSALLGEGSLRMPFDAPSGSQARLVLVAPRALAADPDFADMWRDDPALIAWSETLAGRTLSDELRSRLLRAQRGGVFEGRERAISTAAAISALSAVFDERGRPDPEAQAARQRAVGTLNGLGQMQDPTGHGALRAQAAIVTALATSGVSDLDSREAYDPVGRILRTWLPPLRRALRDVPGEPTLLARASAALLLADPRDGHARAMFNRLVESLESAPGGQRVVPSAERASVEESVQASIAAALAAHQLGRSELARDLLGYAGRHAADIARNGGESAFWWFAANAYGAFGDSPDNVVVRIDGTRHEVDLSNGSATLPLSGNSTIRFEGGQGPVLARAEAVFGRELTARRDAPLRLELRGESGGVGELAAYELEITATRAVNSGVLDVQLPAAVDADERFLAVLQGNAHVRQAEARNPGFVRIWLAPIADEARATIPIPLRWQAVGQVRGLAMIAYEADQPGEMTILPPRTLTIADAD